MTEQPTRAWYQDGFTVFMVCLFGGLGFLWLKGQQQETLPHVFPEVKGRVSQPLIGNNAFLLTVWHHHTGAIENGRLVVRLTGPQLPENEAFELFSFAVWQPNEENARQFTFPLKYVDSTSEIKISLTVSGTNIKPTTWTPTWLGSGWKKSKGESSDNN